MSAFVPQDDGTRLSIAQSIDRICDEFEEAWAAGARPRIEDFLDRLPVSNRSSLLRELLATELQFRNSTEAAVCSDEYLARFSTFAAVVEYVFSQVAKAEGANPATDTATDLAAGTRGTNATAAYPADVAPVDVKDEAFPRRFADYELLGEIARGGMGVVFKARQLTADRIVAVKMILSGNLASLEEIQRFYTEARAAANLKHPNIIGIHEVGLVGGQHFYSMDFIEGRSLADLVREGAIVDQAIARFVRRIANAVQYAHEQGVLHRDLKPSNVLVDENGEPHVTDFGLAKRTDADSGLTATEQILGTPSYMPPEQARGDTKKIGKQSDVYSLGALMYALLTGRPPFHATNVAETLRQVLDVEPIPPTMLNPSVDQDLETICLKCLEKEPAKRYATARDLSEELGRYQRGEPIQARPLSRTDRAWRWCKRNPAVAALSAVAAVLLMTTLVATAVGYWTASAARILADKRGDVAVRQRAAAELAASLEKSARREAENAGAREQAARVSAEKSAADATRQQQIARAEQKKAEVARDNERKAKDTAKQREEESRQRLVRVFSTQGLRLMEEGDPFGAAVWFAEVLKWTPDDPRIEQSHRIRLAMSLCQSPRLEMVWRRDSSVTSVAFSPDGKNLAAGGAGVSVCDLETRKVVHKLELVPIAFPPALTAPDSVPARVDLLTFSPDGRYLIAGAMLHDIPETVDNASPPPKGTSFLQTFLQVTEHFTTGGGGMVRVWDTKTWQPTSAAVKLSIKPDIAAFAPDHRWVAVGHILFSPITGKSTHAVNKNNVHVLDLRTGKPLEVQEEHVAAVTNAAAAVQRGWMPNMGREYGVRMWDMAKNVPVTPLLRHANEVTQAVRSPDGRRLATASHDGTVRLWDLANLNQFSGAELAACRGKLWAGNNRFAVDRRHLCEVDRHGRTFRVVEQSTKQARAVGLVSIGLMNAASYSPDGRYLLLLVPDGAVVLDATTGAAVAPVFSHPKFIVHAEFSNDGKRLVTAGASETRVWDVVSGKTVFAPIRHENKVRYAAFSPDGTRLVTATDIGETRVWDAATGKPLSPTMRQQGEMLRAWFTLDGRRVLALSKKESPGIWDAATGRRLLAGEALPANLSDVVAISPDGYRVFAAGILDSSPRRWDLRPAGARTPPPPMRTGAELFKEFEEAAQKKIGKARSGVVWESGRIVHEGTIKYMEFSPDGKSLLTADNKGMARIWNSDNDKAITIPMKHGDLICHAAFSSDGICVATASWDHTARLWDATTGEPLSPPILHDSFVRQVLLSPDGRHLATCDNSYLRIWDVGPDQRPLDDLLSEVQFLAGHRIDDTGALVPFQSRGIGGFLGDGLPPNMQMEIIREDHFQRLPFPNSPFSPNLDKGTP